MKSTYSTTSSPSGSDGRILSIQNAMEVLDGILHPYADSRMDNKRRRDNLEEIVKRAAAFAFTLFSQPSSWQFDWMAEQSVKTGSLCIFPALLQRTDESGNLIHPPRELTAAIVRQLDS